MAKYDDDLIRIWNMASGNILCDIEAGRGKYEPWSISQDARWLVLTDGKIWNLEKRQIISELPVYSPGIPGESANFSPDGRFLAYAAPGNQVKVWDIIKKQERASLKGHDWYIYATRFSPDGKLLATIGAEGTRRLWHADSYLPILPPLMGYHWGDRAASFTPDGATFISSDQYGAGLWNVAARQGMLRINSSFLITPNSIILRLYGWSFDGLGSKKLQCISLPTLAEVDAVEKGSSRR